MTPQTGMIVALALALLCGAAEAHPHIWIDSRSEIIFDHDGAVRAVRQTWTFDEMYSAYATQGLDADRDGTLSREELEPVTQANVESLVPYDYFTFLKTASGAPADAAFSAPVDAWSEHDGSQLTFHFTLPLERPVDPKAVRTAIEVFDPAYFIGFELAEDGPVRLVDAPEDCRPRTGRAKGFEKAVADKLAQIPATGELPPDLLNLTAGNANTIRVICK